MKLVASWDENDWEGYLYTEGYFNGCAVLSTRPYTEVNVNRETDIIQGLDRLKFRYRFKNECEFRGWDLPIFDDPDYRITFYNDKNFFTYGRDGEYKARFGFPPGMTSFLHLFEYFWHVIDVVYLPINQNYPNDNVYLK